MKSFNIEKFWGSNNQSLIYSVVPSFLIVYLVVKVVDYYSCAQLYQEQCSQDPGVGGGESMMLVDGSAGSTERDESGDETNEDEEDRDRVETVAEEVEIFAVCHLQNYASNDQDTPEYL